MHRDVSAGNVMLDEHGKGVLNDWDHAIEIVGGRKAAEYRTVSVAAVIAIAVPTDANLA